MKKKIKISVGDIEQSARRFVGTWRKIERGEPVASQEYLTFDNLDSRGNKLSSLSPGGMGKHN